MAYDFNSVLQAIGSDYTWVSGNQSDTVTPGLYNTVSFTLSKSNQTIQGGSIPLITVAGTQISFWFHSGGSTPYINICVPTGFSQPTNTSTENVIANSAYSVYLNGGGNTPNTNTIYINLYPASLWSWIGYYGQTVYSPWAQPPTLVIQSSNTGTLQVFLDGAEISNWTFDSSASQLSWNVAGGNQSQASVVFSTNSDGVLSFTRTLDVDPNDSGGFGMTGTFSGQACEAPVDQTAQSLLQQLFKNNTLVSELNAELQTIGTTYQTQLSAGTSTSQMINDANQTLTTWFQQQGYTTTPQALFEALLQFGQSDLLAWLGMYGNTQITPAGSVTQTYAPVFSIVLDENQQPVPQVFGVTIQNYTFSTGNLVWSIGGGNATGGNIQFYYNSPISLNGTPPRVTPALGSAARSPPL